MATNFQLVDTLKICTPSVCRLVHAQRVADVKYGPELSIKEAHVGTRVSYQYHGVFHCSGIEMIGTK